VNRLRKESQGVRGIARYRQLIVINGCSCDAVAESSWELGGGGRFKGGGRGGEEIVFAGGS
jgi:hypothetical protein